MEPVTQILRKVKITLVGDNNVGRLSYLKTIVDGADDFKPSTENPSVFVRLPHILDSDFNQFYLELDCKIGNDRWNNRSFTSLNRSTAAFIIFDLCDRLSFENVRNWYNEICRFASPNCMIVVVGTKSDLLEERKVTYQEATALSDSIDAIHYYETNRFNPHQKRLFEKILANIVYYSDFQNYTAPSASININRARRPLARSTELPAIPQHTNLQMSMFRLVFNNRLLSNLIFEQVSKIHCGRGSLVGHFQDNKFLSAHHYYNVFSYKLAKQIDFSVPTTQPSFFELLRKCTDAEVTKHMIHQLPASELAENSIKIADELVIAGDVSVVAWLYKEYKCRCSMQALRYSIVNGDFNMLAFILETVGSKRSKQKQKKDHELTKMSNLDKDNLITFAKSFDRPDIEKYLNDYKITSSTFLNRLKSKIIK